jgi:hypothetical protein
MDSYGFLKMCSKDRTAILCCYPLCQGEGLGGFLCLGAKVGLSGQETSRMNQNWS